LYYGKNESDGEFEREESPGWDGYRAAPVGMSGMSESPGWDGYNAYCGDASADSVDDLELSRSEGVGGCDSDRSECTLSSLTEDEDNGKRVDVLISDDEKEAEVEEEEEEEVEVQESPIGDNPIENVPLYPKPLIPFEDMNNEQQERYAEDILFNYSEDQFSSYLNDLTSGWCDGEETDYSTCSNTFWGVEPSDNEVVDEVDDLKDDDPIS